MGNTGVIVRAYQGLEARLLSHSTGKQHLNKKLIAILVVVIVVAAVVGIVAEQYVMPQQQPPVPVRDFAAASLVNVINASQPTFEKGNNAKLLVNLASSTTLYAQIVAGTPADVFMSADSSLLAKLNQQSLLYNDKYWNFTTNILVVILPPGNPQHITSLSDLTKPGIRIAVTSVERSSRSIHQHHSHHDNEDLGEQRQRPVSRPAMEELSTKCRQEHNHLRNKR